MYVRAIRRPHAHHASTTACTVCQNNESSKGCQHTGRVNSEYSLVPRPHTSREEMGPVNLGKKLGPRAGICACQSDHSSSVVM